MTHAEMIDQVVQCTSLKQADIRKILNAWGHICACALVQGDTVPLPCIGSLKTKWRAERTGRNPKTGEAVTISARTVVKLAPSKLIKEILNP